MSPERLVLLHAPSIADAHPGRWWLPGRELLAAVEPGRAEVKVLAVELGDEGHADIWNARAVWLDVEERDALLVTGTIVATELEREGFAEGDRLAVELDRIFDLVLFNAEGDAEFNVARAEFAVGKRVLVGITELSHDGREVLEKHAFAGVVSRVVGSRGIELALDDGTSYWLPPDVTSLREAAPAEYRLHATGQTVVNPDYLATWTITAAEGEAGCLSGEGYAPPPAE